MLSEDDSSERAGPSFLVANLVIYCADFADRIEGSTFCDALPRNEFTISPIGPVDVDRPILVIGTEFDPVTPGHHAAEFADALGDAVHIVWEGVGHTAFPGSSRCVDRIVTDHLLDGPLPDDGLRCSFVDGVSDEAELADDLFAHDRLVAAIVDRPGAAARRASTPTTAACVGRVVGATRRPHHQPRGAGRRVGRRGVGDRTPRSRPVDQPIDTGIDALARTVA